MDRHFEQVKAVKMMGNSLLNGTTQVLSTGDEAIYTECHRRNGPNFGSVFLMLNYTNITQNTYIQS